MKNRRSHCGHVYCLAAALASAAFALLAGCDNVPPSPPGAPSSAAAATTAGSDAYDVSKMDLKTPPAVLSNDRHTGVYAAGSALSMDATLKPLDPSPIKEVQLDTTHKIIEIAPGVKFSAWTFGDQVPGPVVRARVGDRIKFTMTNRSDEAMPAGQFVAAPMMHSMDFHSAMVSPQDKYRSIAPGQTISFEFTANYPGVFMYHCGTPMVLEHIASGMYGMMIVEPRGGYPTKVDREYAILQSEFYTKPDPQRRKIDGAPLYVLDGDRLRSKAPTYTVFNGRHNGFVDKPLPSKPGERVRLYVMNVGPSNTSSFHVVGTIFDRVWTEGNPDNQLRGMQTVLLGSSSGAIVEFIVPEAGSYIMVDHHFANASQGAIGLIAAGGKPDEHANKAADAEHHNIAATATPTDAVAVRGKLAFESKCLACHSVGGGDKLGPDVYGVTRRREDAWLVRWMKNPEKMLQSDPIAKEMLARYKVPMPNQNLSESEVREYIAYFKWADVNLRPQGAKQPQPAAPGTAKNASETTSTTPMGSSTSDKSRGK
ncbi:MAG: c-type cytochrome [Burkholderiaceae bacterium]|nr:c-type cytochrome [Burkholderiaceae bacterium]